MSHHLRPRLLWHPDCEDEPVIVPGDGQSSRIPFVESLRVGSSMSVIPVMRPWFGPAEAAAAVAAIDSGWVAQGPRVAEFEERLARRVGAVHGVAVSSCTAALHLSLLITGIGPGDDVVVPSLSFIATANAVRQAGANPVFADVDRRSQNITQESVAAAWTPRTRAIIAVHQVGMPADVDGLSRLAHERGVRLIEDAACAIGSTYRDEPIGSHSDLVAFSFHPRKILTTGEGGMVVTSDEELANRLRRLRQHGMDADAFSRHERSAADRERYLEPGWNYRMTDIQAGVGIVQLDKLDAMVARRRLLAARYADGLGDVPTLGLPTDPPFGTTNFQSYVVVIDEDHPERPPQLIDRMLASGVALKRGVMAAHLEPAYRDHPHGPLTNTEFLAMNSVILPMYHELSDTDQDRIIELVRNR